MYFETQERANEYVLSNSDKSFKRLSYGTILLLQQQHATLALPWSSDRILSRVNEFISFFIRIKSFFLRYAGERILSRVDDQYLD